MDQGLRHELMMRGLREATIDHYTWAILRAKEWMDERGIDINTATPHEVHAYCEEMVPNTWASRSMVRKALTALWKVVGRADPPIAAIHTPPEPEFDCRAIPDYQARKLADTAYDWEAGADGLGVLFGLYAALRRFETAKIEWEHITHEFDGWWLEVQGKGKRTAKVPLHTRIVDRLHWWRGFTVADGRCRKTRPGQRFVFQGFRDHSVSPHTVNDWVKNVAAEAGVDELASHELRHTCLATVNDQTRDLRGTQQLARHKNPTTTARYTRVHRERLVGIVDGLDY